MKLTVSSVCDTGKLRRKNQDAILVYQDEEKSFALFLVADGMGGHTDGERASRTIALGIRDWLNQNCCLPGSASDMLCAVRDRMLQIHDYIWTHWNQQQICGSTCALLFFLGTSYGVFSVGDSRVYRCRQLRCSAITRDDVWENPREIIAQYQEKELRMHPDYGKLVHAVGSEQTLGYSMFTDTLCDGDTFALCSDGIYKMCGDGYLKRKLRFCRWMDLDKARNQIVASVYRNGAKDNLSLILVRYMA